MERDWLVPAAACTAGLVLFVILFAPPDANYAAAFTLFPLWMGCAFLILLALLVARTAICMARGEQHPAREVAALARSLTVAVGPGMALAGINMIAFMWVKPLLNYLVPFRADPLLARIDLALFLGHRPDRLFAFLNSDATAIFYHRAWFALMIGSLFAVLASAPGKRKSALILTYFLLWTLVGPLIHCALPAGGPIFFARLGYGDLYAGLVGAPITNEIADYLWGLYTSGGFGPGAGISAMPSLHIATSLWCCIAVPRRWRWPVSAVAALIFLLSLSLGWHYAIDGLAGGALALGIYRLLGVHFAARGDHRRAAAAV